LSKAQIFHHGKRADFGFVFGIFQPIILTPHPGTTAAL